MAREKLAAILTTATEAQHIGETFKGRTAWAALLLSDAGKKGVSRLEHASTSLPFYVWQIRQVLGDDSISTEHESHGGPFAGSHARYRWTDPLMRFEKVKEKPASDELGGLNNPYSIGQIEGDLTNEL